jgi:hypothetical protein
LLATFHIMSEQTHKITGDEIRDLITRVDGELRQAEILRNYANERQRRADFFPERRQAPRIPRSDETP